MGVLAVGLNHRTASLDLRERFAFAPDRLVETLQGFRRRVERIPEVAIVSTCNRTELYLGTGTSDAHAAAAPTVDWLAEFGGVDSSALREHAYLLEGGAAARHAFRVASGLDSMVLGEPQILGQMKQAVREADSAGTLGTTLHQMFQRSFAIAKEVRSSTEIGAHSISMAAAAVRLASQLFEDLSRLRVALVGAGEMIELVATHFAARSPRSMTIANRTLERGQQLAARFGAETMRLAELPQRLGDFDIVISCTASSLPIIGLGAVERAVKARKRRPMFMLDLAVPRDIEQEVASLADVYLYTVDDLLALVQSAGERRLAAVEQAEVIIESGVQGFVHWLGQRSTVPLIQSLQAQAGDWRAAELARAHKLLARGADVPSVLEALSRGLTQKMLHGAMTELNACSGDERAQLAQAVARIFLRGAGDPAADGVDRGELGQR